MGHGTESVIAATYYVLRLLPHVPDLSRIRKSRSDFWKPSFS
jgi:hypothetical protein